MQQVRFDLNPEMTREHRRVIATYLAGHGHLRADEWRLAFAAFDLLGQSWVTTVAGVETFADVYRRLIEDVYADAFIEELLGLQRDVSTAGDQLKAAIARRIQQDLGQAGLYQRGMVDSMYLLAYSYYWWDSFARGYIFEVTIFRDLEASGIEFIAHDLVRRAERYSSVDLIVSGQTGDIKTSTYFLHTARTRTLRHDFYVTRLWDSRRQQRVRAVIMREEAWQEIDGETVLTEFDHAAELFPEVVRVRRDDVVLVIVEYEIWKGRVKAHQEGGQG